MGYDTMRRRSELVGFEFEDLTCLLNGKPALRLRFSKADQYGEGRLIGISKDLEGLIAKWAEIVEQEDKILRSVDRHGNIGEKLEPSAVSSISCGRFRRLSPSPATKNPASGRGIRFSWELQSIQSRAAIRLNKLCERAIGRVLRLDCNR